MNGLKIGAFVFVALMTSLAIIPTAVIGANEMNIQVNEFVNPSTITLGNTTKVTLTVNGTGTATVETFPIDVMLVTDTSGSMEDEGGVSYFKNGSLIADNTSWQQAGVFSIDPGVRMFLVAVMPEKNEVELKIESPSGVWYGYGYTKEYDPPDGIHNTYLKDSEGSMIVLYEKESIEGGTWKAYAKSNYKQEYELAVADPRQKIDFAKLAGSTFLNNIKQNDRAGLVSFESSASLEHGLTFDKNAVDSQLTGLKAEGGTAMGDGILKANQELFNNGREGAKKAEVLLTDGEWTTGKDPIDAAEDAKEKGIMIYTVGLGFDINTRTLLEIADVTGGKFYYAASSAELQKIYEEIATEIGNIIAEDVVVTNTLPAIVEYHENASAAPSKIEENADGTTTLSWNLRSVSINESWSVSFDVKANETGNISVNTLDSNVTYIDVEGKSHETGVPLAYLTVENITAEIERGAVGGKSPAGDNSGGTTTTTIFTRFIESITKSDFIQSIIKWIKEHKTVLLGSLIALIALVAVGYWYMRKRKEGGDGNE